MEGKGSKKRISQNEMILKMPLSSGLSLEAILELMHENI